MKTKKIWIGSLIFGLIAALILSFILFTDTKPKNSVPASGEVKKESKQASKKDDSSKASEKSNSESSSKKDEATTRELLPITSGNRAMSIQVTDISGISGFIKPGLFVDVVTALRPPQEAIDKGQHEAAVILLQNVKVLGVGHAADTEDEAKRYQTVTLEVTPKQGLALGLVGKSELYLMLREDSDHQVLPDVAHMHIEEIHEGVYK